MRLFRVVFVLVILGLGGLIGYAYFGDMDAQMREVRQPVELQLGTQPVPATPAPEPSPATPAIQEQAPAPAAGQDVLD